MYILEPYDNALRLILEQGVWKNNRTGIRTKAVFGILNRYRISERFPILTGRRVWPKAIWGELLWIISGSTNNKDLQSLGSEIWTPWVDSTFEREFGFAEGSFGPTYGFQLRHFGGEYGNGIGGQNALYPVFDEAGDTGYTFEERRELTHLDGKFVYGDGGFDQLAYVVKMLKKEPNSRRILWSLWSPDDMYRMRLPPCHYSFQLFVHDNKLSGLLTQRSCDFPIGVPANIQFYSTMIYMLAAECGYEPYEFVHSTVDSHIYENQIPQVEEYLARPKPESPRLRLDNVADIYSYTLDCFHLEDYNPQPAIKIPVAV